MSDPVAIVTGGASGIGRAICLALLADGMQVAALDLTTDGVAEAVLAIECDVRDDQSVRAAVAHVVDRFGRLDVVCLNAGIGAAGTVADNDDEQWHRVFDVNVVGMARVARAALPQLRRSPAASMVLTSSIAATAGLPNRALYSATKGAVLSLARAMAADHIGEGIRVNAVAPGTADTPWVGRLLAAASDPEAERAALAARQPMGRLVTAGEVAAAVAYLAGPAASATTGTVLEVDGGMAGLRLRK